MTGYGRLSAVLYLVCNFALAQTAWHASISGTVIDASNNEAVRKAVVTLTFQGPPRAWATTRTDAGGRFAFEGLPAGKYALHAQKEGLGTANYGSESSRELGDLIPLSDGETVGDVKLRFVRSASISGRVVDPDGDPMQNVNVALMRAGRNLGERVLVNFRGGNTDDRGEYKITVSQPGEYYLRCNPHNFFMGSRFGRAPSDPAPQEMLIPQFFGGASESKDAAPLKIRSGEVITGMDFHLTAQHAAMIRGRVTGVPQMDPPVEPPHEGFVRLGENQFVNVELAPVGEGQMFWGGGVGAQPPDYQFAVPNQPPGRYRLTATVRAKDKTYYASQIVDANENTPDIVLALAPAVEVKGHLKIEGEAPAGDLRISLAAAGPGPRRESYSATVAKDGSFVIKDVPPGELVWNLDPPAAGTFEKSVRLGDKSYLYQRLEIPAGSDAPLNIVLSSNTTFIEGQVDAGGADVKRAGILLAPIDSRRNLARFYYSTIADDSGKFKLEKIAPGKYKIFALEKIAADSFRNPESEALLENFGGEVDVPEGGKIQPHAKLIPFETAREILQP